VLHLAARGPEVPAPGPDGAAGADAPPARVGFVVSKAVGNAVHRNRVKRRLRNLVRERLTRLPAGAVLVVRALPAAAGASFGSLARDLDTALARLDLPHGLVVGR
jgi:ribonuclease P protein component